MSGKKRYAVHLRRGRGRGRKPLTKTVYTYAQSPKQAERSVRKRGFARGYSTTSVRSDPAPSAPRANPKGTRPVGRPLYIEYVHDQNGQHYYHHFSKDARIQALPDGALRIYHPDGKMWVDV